MTSNHRFTARRGDLAPAVISSGEEEAGNEQDEIAVSCALPACSSPEEITAGARSPPAGSEPVVARHTGVGS